MEPHEQEKAQLHPWEAELIKSALAVAKAWGQFREAVREAGALDGMTGAMRLATLCLANALAMPLMNLGYQSFWTRVTSKAARDIQYPSQKELDRLMYPSFASSESESGDIVCNDSSGTGDERPEANTM